MKFQIANYQIHSLILDLFRLDGGAMFGSVPKTLWEKDFPADDKNRIQLCSRSLMLEGEGRKILVDAGSGVYWSDKEREIFCIQNLKQEAILKMAPDITDVVLTHLHFDHAGGITSRIGEELVPIFPKARHWLSKDNFERAKAPGVREKVSYRKSELEILSKVDLRLFEDKEEILPNLVMHNMYGHTYGMSVPIVMNKDKCGLIFLADLIPTSSHIRVPYVMGYDLLAEVTMREKVGILDMAHKDGALLVFEHDPKVSAIYLGQDEKNNYIVKEKLELDLG